jgi:hypothetical protein
MAAIIEVSGDERRLLEALRKSERAIDDRLVAALKKTTNEAKAADRELAAFAKRTSEVDTTPVEKLREELQKVQQAKEKGFLDEDKFGRAKIRLEKQLAEAMKPAEDPKVLAALQKKQAAVQAAAKDMLEFAKRTKEIDTTKIERLTAELQKVERAAKLKLLNPAEFERAATRIKGQIAELNKPVVDHRAAEALREHQEAIESAERRLSARTNWADNFKSVAAGVGAATAAMWLLDKATQAVTISYQKFHDEQAAAVQSSESLFDVTRDLAQVSNINETVPWANQLAAKHGLTNIEARRLLADAGSAGVLSDQQLITNVAAGKGLIDPGSAINAAANIPKLFSGHKLGSGDALDLISVGANDAQIMMKDFTADFSRLMEQGGRTAISPTDAAASLATLSHVLPGKAAERINALLGQIAKDDELKQLPFLEVIKRAKVDEGVRQQLLEGNNEASAAFEKIVQFLPAIEERSRRYEQEIKGDPFGKNLVASLSGPEGEKQLARLGTVAAEAAKEQAINVDAVRANNWKTVRDQLDSFDKSRGVWGVTRAMRDWEYGGYQTQGSAEDYLMRLRLRETDDARIAEIDRILDKLQNVFETAGGNFMAVQRARSSQQKDQ